MWEEVAEMQARKELFSSILKISLFAVALSLLCIHTYTLFQNSSRFEKSFPA